MFPIVWPKSGHGTHLEAQVSPKLPPRCGPSILDAEPTALPQASTNGPYCAAQVSPNWTLLFGPSLPDMTPTLLLEFPRNGFFLRGPSLPKNVFTV